MLELDKIKKSYDGVTILDNISLSIENEEVLSILGPSGCGKTMSPDLILGTTDANSGEIWFEGRNITHVPMEEWGFNVVFQDYVPFPNLNVYKNITYGLRNKPDISIGQEVQELIDLLGLGEHLARGIDQLPGGQKQRVALARTMVMKPRVFLLDKSLGALDDVIKRSIKEKIEETARELKLATIIVIHDPEEALTLSDKVLIANEGDVARSGRPKETIGQPADSSAKNFTLNQLEVKRNSTFTLFNREMTRSSSQRISYTARKREGRKTYDKD